MVLLTYVLKLSRVEWIHVYSVARVEGDGLIVLVEDDVQMVANADFDLVLHHGLLDGSQVAVQCWHQQHVGELKNCAAGRDNDGIVLAPGDERRYALLSGLDHHVGLGGHAKREPAQVVEHVLVTLGVHVKYHVSVVLRKAR
eukprot:286264-Pleurochrysis_carterae.AAC.2